MPMYIQITAKGDAKALLDSLTARVRLEAFEDGKWFINENGDVQKRLEEGDARSAQAFTPQIEGKILTFRFANDGVYEPSDYAEYYGHFIEMLIKNHRTRFIMIRVQFTDKEELDVERPASGDTLNMLPAKQIKTTLENEELDPDKRIREVLRLMKSFGY